MDDKLDTSRIPSGKWQLGELKLKKRTTETRAVSKQALCL